MKLLPALSQISKYLGLVVFMAIGPTLGCGPSITSNAKPKLPPSVQVRLPDIDAGGVSTSGVTTTVPTSQPFVIHVTVHGIDEKARKKGLVSLHFVPPKGSPDEAKNWLYGAAFLVPKDESSLTWECSGECVGVGTRQVPMRAVIALGDVAVEKPIAELKVDAIEYLISKETKSNTP